MKKALLNRQEAERSAAPKMSFAMATALAVTLSGIAMAPQQIASAQTEADTEEPVLLNGDFEDGLTGWTHDERAATSQDTYEGDGAGKVQSGGPVYQPLKLQPNMEYTATAFVKGEAKIGLLNDSQSDVEYVLEEVKNDEYAQVTLKFESGDTGSGYFYFESASEVRVDNVTVTQSSTQSSMLTNGDFEDGISSWKSIEPATEAADPYEGDFGVTIGAGGAIYHQAIPLEFGMYKLSADVKGQATIGVVTFNDGVRRVHKFPVDNDEYSEVSFEGALKQVDSATVFVASTSEASVDNVSFTKLGDPDPRSPVSSL